MAHSCILLSLVPSKTDVSALIKILLNKLETAQTIKVVGIEIAQAMIKDAIQNSSVDLDSKEVSPSQRASSEKLQEQLASPNIAPNQAALLLEAQIKELARSYEAIRQQNSSGSQRTAKMNQIVSQMRILALSAEPLLPILANSNLPGERLAAVAILEVKPNAFFQSWLADRFSNEKPFVFFHASLALKELAKISNQDREENRAVLRSLIEQSLAQVESFKMGTPDRDTILVLNEALRQLKSKQ